MCLACDLTKDGELEGQKRGFLGPTALGCHDLPGGLWLRIPGLFGSTGWWHTMRAAVERSATTHKKGRMPETLMETSNYL